MTHNKIKDYLLLQFVILLWGFTVILGLLVDIPAMEVVFYRTGIATVALIGLLLVKHKDFKVGWIQGFKITAVGFIIALHWILFFGAAKISNASICLAGMATAAFWTSIIDPFVSKRGYRWYETLIGLFVVVGLAIILGVNFDYLAGLAIAMVSALLASIFTILNGRLVKNYSHYTITFYQMGGAFIATALFLPFSELFFPEMGKIDLVISRMDFIWLSILAIVCTVYAFSVSVKVMRSISPYLVNLSINMEPIYGMILAVLIFPETEKMEPGFYLGALVIIGSLAIYPLVFKWDKRKAAKVRTLD